MTIREIKLDDWHWDYEKVLRDNDVEIYDASEHGASFYWKHGTGDVICIKNPRKAIALFISLWLLGVSATFADKIMDAYALYLDEVE